MNTTELTAASNTTRVVFVCEHGAAKSMIAAVTFNRLAAEHGLHAHAVSRGTDPDSEIPGLVVDGLRAHGEDVRAVQPIGLSPADAADAGLFVVFDVEAPAIVGDVSMRRWDGMPMVMENFAIAREAIGARVLELVSELSEGATEV